MEAFLVSVLAVTVGEIGDKTQLLALFLAARFKKPVPIILGILCATLANHTVAALLGQYVADNLRGGDGLCVCQALDIADSLRGRGADVADTGPEDRANRGGNEFPTFAALGQL